MSTSTRATPARGSTAPPSTASATPPARASSTSSPSTAPTGWPAATPTRSSCWRSSARPAATSSSSSGRSPTTRTTSSCSRSRGPSPSTSGPCSPSGSAAASSRRPGPATGSPARPPTATATSPRGTASPAHLEVDEAEAEVVRMLYRWLIDERMTVRQILKRLADGPWRPRSGKRLWSNSVVHRILSDPLYAGTAYANRNALVVPRKPRSTGPSGGPADLPTSRARARSGSPIPVPAHHRRVYSSECERTTRPQLGPVLPEQHPQRLPAPLPAHLPDLRPGHVRRHHQRCRRTTHASVLQVPRQGHRRSRPRMPLPAGPDQGRGARRGRLGARQGVARRPGHAGRPVRGAGPTGRRTRRRCGQGRPEVGGPAAAARPRGAAAARRLPGRGDRPR